MTQLTQLTLSFKEWATIRRMPVFLGSQNFMECTGSVEEITLRHAHALSMLTNLQSLSLTGPSNTVIFTARSKDYSFLRQLRGLTSLTLAVVEKHKLAKALGACRHLQELHLIMRCEERTAKRRPKLTASSATAAEGSSSMQQLVQLGSSLTQLTSLQLQHYNVADVAALQRLLQPFQDQLQLLRLDGLTAEAVPVLLGLTRLTELRGTWKAGVAEPAMEQQSRKGTGSSHQQQQKKMVTVQKLAGKGPIPFQLFPDLQEFEQWDTLDADCFVSLASYCPKLTALTLAPMHRHGFDSMDEDFLKTRGEAVAVRSLACLQQLAELHYAPRAMGEVEFLVSLTKLKRLVLRPDDYSMCSSFLIGEEALRFKGEMLVLDFRYRMEDVMRAGLRAQLEMQPNVIIRDSLER